MKLTYDGMWALVSLEAESRPAQAHEGNDSQGGKRGFSFAASGF